MIRRRKTRELSIGKVKVGGDNPVVIQGMIKTPTENINKAADEINALKAAGAEIVRVAVKTKEAASKLSRIKSLVGVPLVADIHFDYRLALICLEGGADKVRINPGNITKREQFIKIIDAARINKKPIRLGLNSGSVPADKIKGSLAEAMYAYALECIKLFEKKRFYDIIISAKTSEVLSTIKVNELIARKVSYPLHLGVTATGTFEAAVIKSSLGIGSLLKEGIGDTIRVSLTEESTKEIEIARIILQSLDIRRFYPEVISCPTCGRCQVDLRRIVKEVEEHFKKDKAAFEAAADKKIAVMGCEVNGPGEARAADIGVACGKDYAALFKKGRIVKRVNIKDVKEELLKELAR